MRNLIIIWAVIAFAIFIYLARTRPRDGYPKDDALRASLSLVWAALWPVTIVSYALGGLYRFINEIGR